VIAQDSSKPENDHFLVRDRQMLPYDVVVLDFADPFTERLSGRARDHVRFPRLGIRVAW